MAIHVTLPDGKRLELPDGASGADMAAEIGPGLARAALAVAVSHPEAGEGPEVRDLARPLPDGAQILLDLGVRDMILLSNTRRDIVGLEGYGLTVIEQRPIQGTGGN